MFYKLNANKKLWNDPPPNSGRGRAIILNSVVEKLGEKEIDNAKWIKIKFRDRLGLSSSIGWMPLEFLDETEPPPRPEFSLWAFLKHCVTAEIWINDKPDTDPNFGNADYLIALANIESKIKNIGEETPGSDAVGPFQISSARWKTFIQESGEEIYDEDDRDDALDQIMGAAFLTREDTRAFSAAIAKFDSERGSEETSGPTGPFVPSYVDIFLAHLVGVKNAVKFRTLKFEDKGETLVDEVLKVEFEAEALDTLLKHRRHFLKASADQVETTDGMYAKIENRLDNELRNAFKLIKENIPEDLPVATGSAPWMAVARKEEEVWKDESVKETNAKGKEIVLGYFKATDLNTNKVLPWCGAFVAHCLKEAGDAVMKTIVKGSAAAANWKKWGNTAIPVGSTDIPEGAVVILSPAPGSSRSGHVGFYTRYLTGGALIELLGGNQGDRVKLSKFSGSKVAAIRWLQTDDVPSLGTGSGTNATFSNPIAQLIADKFAERGYGKIQQIAAVANAIRESNLNPKAHNTRGEDSVGLFQLNRNGGLGAGKSVAFLKAPENNIRIILDEADKLPQFKNATTIEKAIDVFVRKIERPANQTAEVKKRIEIARGLMAGN